MEWKESKQQGQQLTVICLTPSVSSFTKVYMFLCVCTVPLAAMYKFRHCRSIVFFHVSATTVVVVLLFFYIYFSIYANDALIACCYFLHSFYDIYLQNYSYIAISTPCFTEFHDVLNSIFHSSSEDNIERVEMCLASNFVMAK